MQQLDSLAGGKSRAHQERLIQENFLAKIQMRFTQTDLLDYFTVDLHDEDNYRDSQIVIKCMPNAYPMAVSAIETIYKVFA